VNYIFVLKFVIVIFSQFIITIFPININDSFMIFNNYLNKKWNLINLNDLI